MTYKVWRRKTDQSVVGYCEAEYNGFEPGGDLSTYAFAIEPSAPVIPDQPRPVNPRLTAVLNDPNVPQTIKNILPDLVYK